MSINLNRKSDYEVVLEQVVEGPEWKRAQDEAFQNLKSTLRFRGFRPGRVPDSIARNAVPAERIYASAIGPLAQRMLDQGIDEYDLFLVEQPVLDYRDAGPDSVVIELQLVVRPEVTLGEYKDLGVEKPEVSLSDEEYQEILKGLLVPYSNWVVVDEPAQENDQLIVDYSSTDEEGPLQGFSGTDVELPLGTNPKYEAVYAQLQGIAPGETRTVTIPLGDDQEGTVGITVNEVQRQVLPEVNDAFVTENNLGESAAAFEETLRANILENKKNQARNAYLDEVLPKILESTEISFPEVMIDEKITQLLNQFAYQIQNQGQDLNSFLTQVAREPETFKEMLRPQALNDLKLEAVLLKIAQLENLEVEETNNRELMEWNLRQAALRFLSDIF